jgi:predicted ArsR family transcriptional regulator
MADDKYAHERELLRRIVVALPDTEPEPLIVDAARIAAALSVTLRSARRILHSLVAAGMAWTMPPALSPGGGRPRQRFRLLIQKLEPR